MTTESGDVLQPGVDYLIDKTAGTFTFPELTEKITIKLAYKSPYAITKGYDLEYFGVGMECERQDFTLFLYRLKGQPAPNASVLADLDKTFSDVSDLSATFRKAIAWAYGQGIIKGYTSGPNEGKFGKGLSITRREAMIMLWRYAGKPAPSAVGLQSARSFTDVKGIYKETTDWCIDSRNI